MVCVLSDPWSSQENVTNMSIFEGEFVEYLGLIIEYMAEDLQEESFITLAPGETAETLVNIPALCKSPIRVLISLDGKD